LSMAYHQHIKQEGMTKSAVDWLYQELTSIWYDKKSSTHIFEQAKEMEKQQLADAMNHALDEDGHTGDWKIKFINDYYIKTYKN